mmetsp:Transcript_10725/g.20720  ORF Transcript_10725/g.20720 Transcript_10725/m.20720 type:complete len:889 (+) Transcript_10725:53-2719(+)|eukprot:CAMPEP_0194574420 /NCGR_PEP_ID=MMETSP0292-20121207/10280_1 /TAXON_ID=39354 /ORGANISM="Heterosigma akashiwo, Strain CCMP2393" /LENGTH=888 /DNA_ID=CAMNT_0039425941 /DNA_START=112 /DNA_END=2778 /DNA_ORIENTATION=-
MKFGAAFSGLLAAGSCVIAKGLDQIDVFMTKGFEEIAELTSTTYYKTKLDATTLKVQDDAYTEIVDNDTYWYLNTLEYESIGAAVAKSTLVQDIDYLSSNTSIQFDFWAGGSNLSYYGKDLSWNIGASSGCLLRNDETEPCNGLQVSFTEQNGTSGVYITANNTVVASGAHLAMERDRGSWVTVEINTFTFGGDMHAIYVLLDGSSVYHKIIYFNENIFNSGWDGTTGSASTNALSNKMTWLGRACDTSAGDETKCEDMHIIKDVYLITTASNGGTAVTKSPTSAPMSSSAPTSAVSSVPTAAPTKKPTTTHCGSSTTYYTVTTSDFTYKYDSYKDGDYAVVTTDDYGVDGEVILDGTLTSSLKILSSNVTIHYDMYVGSENNTAEAGYLTTWSFGTSSSCVLRYDIYNAACKGVIVAFISAGNNTGISVIRNGTVVEHSDYTGWYGAWTAVSIDVLVLSDGVYALQVLVDGVDYLSGNLIKFVEDDFNSLVQGESSAGLSNKFMFMAKTCGLDDETSGMDCADGHVVTDLKVEVTTANNCSKHTSAPATVTTALPATIAPTAAATMSPTSSAVTAAPTTSGLEWTFYIDHLERMYDAYKKGHTVHLTDNTQYSFGLAFIPPVLADLIGFGTNDVNLTFNVTFVSSSTGCSGIGFVLDYGTKMSCLFKKSSSEDELDEPDCDGISLGLISDPEASGVFVAKQDSIEYEGSSTSFEDKTTTITMMYKYDDASGGQTMQFLMDGTAVSSPVDFTTANIAQGSRGNTKINYMYPKITFAAATTTCSEAHIISGFELEMEKELSATEKVLLGNVLELQQMELMEEYSSLHEMFDNFAAQFKGSKPSSPVAFLGLSNAQLLAGVLMVAGAACIALVAAKRAASSSQRTQYFPI